MIPAMNITAWSKHAPWAEQRQVEQDLIISRAIIELFSDEFLSKELRFRGGTALNKLHFPAPLRYSEDIDLVRTTKGEIKPVLRRVREVLEPWLGKAEFVRSNVSPKLIFRADAEDGGPVLVLKVEIAIWETDAYDGPVNFDYEVQNDWFMGKAAIPTYTNEEMLATKLRALLQRNKGRDLVDLSHAMSVFEILDTSRVVALFQQYMDAEGHPLTRAQAEQRMFAKLASPTFIPDIKPLLTPDEADRLTNEAMKEAFVSVFGALIVRLPGDPWKRTAEMNQRFGLVLGTAQ
jgi:predicted nucleotidyltransferase component of viral defense system